MADIVAEAKELASFAADKKMDKGLISFVSILGSGIVIILCSGFIPALQDFTMIIVAVMFLVAGIVSTLGSGMKGKTLAKTSWQGVTSIFPAVLMILMASSMQIVKTWISQKNLCGSCIPIMKCRSLRQKRR